ncbi:MAG TPA: TetR/AcrR family transcriptional regulator [Candidatus Binatia bacterium]|nr:TetR/AcrR family transcriptional regulator [Candidatus Binatia bacterium]
MNAIPVTSPPTRMQRRRAQTRRDLLMAAQRILARAGYHNAKVADIAREADVGVGTFYLYYPTKEALFTELVEETARIFKRELDALIVTTPDPSDRARASIEMFLRLARDHRELFRIVFGHGAEFHDVVRRTQARFVADVRAVLQQGMASGVFRRNRPEVLAPALIGLSDRVLSWWIEQDDVALEEVTASVLDFFFHGVGTTPVKKRRKRA